MIPMNLTTVTPLVGTVTHLTNKHTAPESAVFIVRKMSGYGAPDSSHRPRTSEDPQRGGLEPVWLLLGTSGQDWRSNESRRRCSGVHANFDRRPDSQGRFAVPSPPL